MAMRLPVDIDGSRGEGGDGACPLVGVQLAVGQAGVVVDDGVGVLVADTGRVVVAIAGLGVTGLVEAGVALGVHVQKGAGARPLIPAHRLSCRAGAA